MIGLGLAALVLIWLVFSVIKRVFGIVLLLALAAAGWALWSNPAMFHVIVDGVLKWVGAA